MMMIEYAKRVDGVKRKSKVNYIGNETIWPLSN